MQSNRNYKVLVVDDDELIVTMLKYNLQNDGYSVETASDGKDALQVASWFRPNLILLDMMMPVMDGLEACRAFRKHPTLSDVHIMFLTARSEESVEIAAFEAAANEYVQKPIKIRALLSRIAALVRRRGLAGKWPHYDQPIKAGDLLIDRESYTVRVGDEEITLPKKEFELLVLLAQNPNRVFTRDELLGRIWGADVYVLPRTVDVHVRKIREKIGVGRIATLKGVGYRFQPS